MLCGPEDHLIRLLVKQDQMMNSIESRVPFLDHEFVSSPPASPSTR